MESNKHCTYNPVLKVWSGRKFTPIYNTEANLGFLVLQRLIQSPQNVFQISDDSGIELTNLEIYKRSIKFVNFLTKSGLKQGDVLGLNASNCEHLAPIIFACFILGIAVNPLATVMDVNDICYMWSKSKPKMIFCDGKVVEKVKIALKKIELTSKIYTIVEKFEGLLSADEILKAEDGDVEDFNFPDLPNISSTTALIICSSGTTNSPKLICKSHKQVITQFIPFVEPNFKSQDVFIISMSSFWVSFHWFLITSALYNFKIVITSKPVTPELWMEIIDRHQITVAVCAPRFGQVLLNSPSLRKMESLRAVIVAGSVFSEKFTNNLMPIFPNAIIQCGYGCTESDCISNTGKIGAKGASSGYPFWNVQIKIIDESGLALEPNKVGEMYYKTPVPFSGYFNDQENYKNSFDSDGFVRSGDIGYVDESGHLFILDRIKHMIKTKSGIQVTPIELEEVINEIDGVMQSCVVGVFDDEVFYDIIYAFVIINKSNMELTEEFVKKYVNERVIKDKQITGGVQIVDKFPMTPSGKVLNRELKEMQVQKIWSGRKFTPIYNTEVNLGYLVLQRLIQSPKNVFQVSDDSGIELTNLDIYKRSIKFVNFLTKSGLKQGDVLGLNASNCEHLAPITFACFILGIAVNSLAVVMDVKDICSMWSKTKPKIIFCDGKVVEKVKNAIEKMELDSKIITVVENFEELLSADEILEAENDNFKDFEFPDLPNISSTIALIVCSSGSTDAPKGVCKSHKQLIAQTFLIYQPDFETQDVFFITTPSYWISFYIFLLKAALFNSKIVIRTSPLTMDAWMDGIERHQVSRTIIVPAFGQMLVKSKNLRPFPSLKTIIVGGERFSKKLLDDLVPVFPNAMIQTLYGCTEDVCITILRGDGLKGTSSGYPAYNLTIKIVDESGKSLGPNEKGEICFKSFVPFSGYFGNPEATKLTFDGEGFVKSGDVGYFDDDGLLYVLYRVKNMIRAPEPGIGALIVAPTDIEEVINEIDGVMLSAVVGVFDIEIYLDKIYAFVIKDQSKLELTEDYIINYVNGKVAEAKKITGGVHFVDKFQLTPSGKVMHRKMKEIAKEIHKAKAKLAECCGV